MPFFTAKKYFAPFSIMLSFLPGAGFITVLSIKTEVSTTAQAVVPLLLQGIIGLIIGALIFAPKWAKLPIQTEGEFITYRYQDRYAKLLHIFRSLYLAWIVIPLIIASTLSYLINNQLFHKGEVPYVLLLTFLMMIGSSIFNSLKQRISLDKTIGVSTLLFLIYYIIDSYKQPVSISGISFNSYDTSSIFFAGVISWWFVGLLDMPDMRAQKLLSAKKTKYTSLLIIAPGIVLFIIDVLLLFGPTGSLITSKAFKLIVLLNFWQLMSTMQHWSGNLSYENIYISYFHKKENKVLIHTLLLLPIVVAFMWSLMLNSTSAVLLTLFGLTAGVGPVYILRWFYWRVNALTQLTAIVGAIILSLFKQEIFLIPFIHNIMKDLPFLAVYNELIILGILNILLWTPTLFLLNTEEKIKAQRRAKEISLLR